VLEPSNRAKDLMRQLRVGRASFIVDRSGTTMRSRSIHAFSAGYPDGTPAGCIRLVFAD
jgi:hypothetical protein